MAENASWKPVEPFGIDNGELEGLTPQEIFTLGVEWEMFRTKLKKGRPFTDQVHTANAERLKAMCQRQGRQVKERWLHEDYAEWRLLDVEGK